MLSDSTCRVLSVVEWDLGGGCRMLGAVVGWGGE